MSIFRMIKREGNRGNTLQDRLTYIIRSTAVRPDYMRGIGVSEWEAYRQMMLVKRTFGQDYGKAYYHYILHPEYDDYDNLNDDKLFKIGISIAELISCFYGHFQVVFAVHFDTEHHLHFIANNIDYMTGKRFDLSPIIMVELKQEINKVLEEAGVSPVLMNTNKNDGQ